MQGSIFRSLKRLLVALGLFFLADITLAAPTTQNQPVFSTREKQWMHQHPVINVLAFDAYAPMSFIDKKMNFSGISADLLTLVRLRTGLNFAIEDAASLRSVRKKIATGKADMVAGIPVNRLPHLRYSRVWLTSKYVMLIRNSRRAPKTLTTPSDMIVAVREGTLIARYLAAHFPHLRLVETSGPTESVDLLAAGVVDAAIAIEANASHQIRRVGRQYVRLAGALNVNPMHIAFGVSPQQPELLSIINKVLDTIPDNDYQQLGSNGYYQGGAFWQRWGKHLWQIGIGTAVILALSLLWGISQRRQVKQRTRMQQMLNEARDEAVASSRAKTNFLSMMSHEIRTPLNAILGILELQIKQNVQAQRAQPMLEVAHDAAKNLLAVVGDILDISRIESGRMALEASTEELIGLTRSVVLLFEEATDQKQLAIHFIVEGGDVCLLKIDPYRYKQILSNLMSNAIKFTQEGEIRVILAHQAADDGQIMVSLTVKDTGIGIAPEDQTRLFKPFTQFGLDGEASRMGTGLGLFICRTLCELMNGELTLSSVPGKGTSVTLQLRLPAVNRHHPQPTSLSAPQAAQAAKRVLIVDDYPPNLMLLRYQLEFLGHQVCEAQNGEEALNLWSQQHHFDYILIDCNMPVMDGFTLAKRLRAQELHYGVARATLLGFTAIAQAEVIEQCLAAGMDGCLFKPCSQEEIGKWIK
ncbi:ATP-binding protein [Kosakonia sp. BYX6]|uniref:histidine kinase n=1 Tax=Kosakonia calanthes TaxID=3139408 RepID=A0ABZ3B1Y6_9ENTR